MTVALEEAQSGRIDRLKIRVQALNLFLVGFLVLFLELARIRWFAAHQVGSLTKLKALALVALVLGLSVPNDWLHRIERHETRWSPYYMVDHNVVSRGITVNSISHQGMVPFASAGSSYSLIHLLQQHSGGAPFRDVLVIGAGSGNDLTHALRFGAKSMPSRSIRSSRISVAIIIQTILTKMLG